MKQSRTVFIIFLTVQLFFLSCSFDKPSVSIPKIQRIYSKSSNNTFSERLAVFVVFDDKDGRNDYEQMILRENSTGLEWTLNRNNTVFLQEPLHSETQQWIGSRKFVYPRNTFPEGNYTLAVTDLSGNTTEQSFELTDPIPVTAEPFSFSLTETEWTITIENKSLCSSFYLIALGADLEPLAIEEISVGTDTTKKDSISSLKDLSYDARYIQCLSENSSKTQGFLSDAIKLP